MERTLTLDDGRVITDNELVLGEVPGKGGTTEMVEMIVKYEDDCYPQWFLHPVSSNVKYNILKPNTDLTKMHWGFRHDRIKKLS